jgi:hypothetical protein
MTTAGDTPITVYITWRDRLCWLFWDGAIDTDILFCVASKLPKYWFSDIMFLKGTYLLSFRSVHMLLARLRDFYYLIVREYRAPL